MITSQLLCTLHALLERIISTVLDGFLQILPVDLGKRVLVLLDRPVFGNIDHTDLLALVEKECAGLCHHMQSKHLGDSYSVLGRIIGETRDRACLIVVLEVVAQPGIVAWICQLLLESLYLLQCRQRHLLGNEVEISVILIDKVDCVRKKALANVRLPMDSSLHRIAMLNLPCF